MIQHYQQGEIIKTEDFNAIIDAANGEFDVGNDFVKTNKGVLFQKNGYQNETASKPRTFGEIGFMTSLLKLKDTEEEYTTATVIGIQFAKNKQKTIDLLKSPLEITNEDVKEDFDYWRSIWLFEGDDELDQKARELNDADDWNIGEDYGNDAFIPTDIRDLVDTLKIYGVAEETEDGGEKSYSKFNIVISQDSESTIELPDYDNMVVVAGPIEIGGITNSGEIGGGQTLYSIPFMNASSGDSKPGDADILPHEKYGELLHSIHLTESYYELRKFNDYAVFPHGAKNLTGTNDYFEFGKLLVKTPQQIGIEQYGNIQQQDTQFLVKTDVQFQDDEGETKTQQSLEYRNCELDIQLPYCDTYMHSTGKVPYDFRSIQLLSTWDTILGRNIPYFQLYQFNNPSQHKDYSITLEWGKTYQFPNNEILVREQYPEFNTSYLNYVSAYLTMPPEPKDWTDDFDALSTRVSTVWDTVYNEIYGHYWVTGGDVSTCYGSDIGNSNANVVINLNGSPIVKYGESTPFTYSDVTFVNTSYTQQTHYAQDFYALNTIYSEFGFESGDSNDKAHLDRMCLWFNKDNGTGGSYQPIYISTDGMKFADENWVQRCELTQNGLTVTSSDGFHNTSISSQDVTSENLNGQVLKIGNTTLNETQLQQLLALIGG